MLTRALNYIVRLQEEQVVRSTDEQVEHVKWQEAQKIPEVVSYQPGWQGQEPLDIIVFLLLNGFVLHF